MEAGREAVLTGDVDQAMESFAAAESAFIRARSQATSPMLRVLSSTPIVGRSVDSVQDMSEAGTYLARAGQVVSTAAGDLPGGISALAPSEGKLALEPPAAAAGPLERASDLVALARDAFDRTPDDLLIGPVGAAHDQFDEALREAERVIHPAAAVTAALPEFLGMNGPRRYFFGAQDPAELRGTGGLIGAYSILTARGGALRFSRFSTIHTLADRSADVEPPNPEYATLYGRFGAPNSWTNLNMTPDGPSAALAIERLYQEVTGRSVDGVILADPASLEALLEVTGPVRVPLTGDRLSAENAIPYLTNEAFSRFPDSNIRKRLLGEAARAVFTRFLSGAARSSPEEAAEALVSAAGGGHLLFHSADPAVQERLEEAGISGSLPADDDEDFLALVGNNAAGNKTDFWGQRRVSHQLRLGPNGTAEAQTTVALANNAPTEGHPVGVIGPYNDDFVAGENVTYLSAYCAPGCGLERFERDGERQAVASGLELKYPVYSTTVRLSSGGRQRLTYSWSLPKAWEGGEGSGSYELTVRGQTTIKPTPLHIDVAVPDGMRITNASEGMQVRGAHAVWQGRTTDELTFRVEFERPFFSRMWTSLVRFLNKPLIRL